MLVENEVRELLRSPKKIIIVTHHKPDGDAMGSSLGLQACLTQLGHMVQVITPTDYPAFLHWLPGNTDVLEYPKHTEVSSELIAGADVVFALDFNRLSRINELGELVRASKAVKINIDHHMDPEDFADFAWNDIMASSASEQVYKFVRQVLDGERLINTDAATCLYTGIMTDSGSFRYERGGSEIYRIAADLIDRGARHSQIQELVYNSFSENRLRLLGYCLYEKMQVWRELNTAVIAISAEELDRFNYEVGDTEGIVNFALTIEGITLAVLMIERPDKVKLSLRSVGTLAVNEIANQHFNGGGHLNAAGGSSELGLQDTLEYLKRILADYKTELQQENE